jgi:hypothetical protein
MSAGQTLGYDSTERATSPYARFFRPEMDPLSDHVCRALMVGAIAPELMPPVEQAKALLSGTDDLIETGFTIARDGAMRIAVLTPMPGVTPAMWDWWFAWHGSEAQRYKLWHPQAHVSAVWDDGRADLDHYIGRISHVVEYIGPERLNLAIRFLRPSAMGLDEQVLAQTGATAICARGSIDGTPMETGWLIHHVRPVPGGCEMRSRFWLGGANVQPRGMPGPLGRIIGQAAARMNRLAAGQARDLLVHCAQEMAHLARILPDLYAAFAKPAQIDPGVQ